MQRASQRRGGPAWLSPSGHSCRAAFDVRHLSRRRLGPVSCRKMRFMTSRFAATLLVLALIMPVAPNAASAQ
ncbi:hypothetical protein NL404_27220, partial [Klebsiella pneumoniae]|nr:hypothetical protein [Klebsiella pneumoniae]